jgi:hypothetical protein
MAILKVFIFSFLNNLSVNQKFFVSLWALDKKNILLKKLTEGR